MRIQLSLVMTVFFTQTTLGQVPFSIPGKTVMPRDSSIADLEKETHFVSTQNKGPAQEDVAIIKGVDAFLSQYKLKRPHRDLSLDRMTNTLTIKMKRLPNLSFNEIKAGFEQSIQLSFKVKKLQNPPTINLVYPKVSLVSIEKPLVAMMLVVNSPKATDREIQVASQILVVAAHRAFGGEVGGKFEEVVKVLPAWRDNPESVTEATVSLNQSLKNFGQHLMILTPRVGSNEVLSFSAQTITGKSFSTEVLGEKFDIQVTRQGPSKVSGFAPFGISGSGFINITNAMKVGDAMVMFVRGGGEGVGPAFSTPRMRRDGGDFVSIPGLSKRAYAVRGEINKIIFDGLSTLQPVQIQDSFLQNLADHEGAHVYLLKTGLDKKIEKLGGPTARIDFQEAFAFSHQIASDNNPGMTKFAFIHVVNNMVSSKNHWKGGATAFLLNFQEHLPEKAQFIVKTPRGLRVDYAKLLEAMKLEPKVIRDAAAKTRNNMLENLKNL